MVKVSRFDAADYLKTSSAVIAYLIEALATRDLAYICTALRTIARATIARARAWQRFMFFAWAVACVIIVLACGNAFALDRHPPKIGDWVVADYPDLFSDDMGYNMIAASV